MSAKLNLTGKTMEGSKSAGSGKTASSFNTKGGQKIKDLLINEETVADLTDDVNTLKQHIDRDQLAVLHERFIQATKHCMNKRELRAAITEETNARFTGDEFDALFSKIDGKRRKKVDWDDLISYLILEFNETYVNNIQELLEVPIQGPPKIIKSRHKRPICKITFYPAVPSLRRVVNYLRGSYLTVSPEGVINFWNLDMDFERSVLSSSVQLKVATTSITDLVCLPDVNIICTSATEGELRFYDTTASSFEIRIVITSLSSAVVCMYYYFDKNIEVDSRLICGDTNGTVTVYSFNAAQKGPFHHNPGYDTRIVRYSQVLKGDLPKMKVTEFRNIHQDWVRQVYYYSSFNSFASCAICPENSVYMCDALGQTTRSSFNVAKGVSCFCVDETSHTMATGGPDCVVRVWSCFVHSKAISVLQGHHTSIVTVIMQKAGKRVVSMSKDRCVKVWDVTMHNCIQNYTQLPPSLGENAPMVVYYNPMNHCILIGSNQIAIIISDKLVSEETTDGTTHRYDVTCILYNPLFEILVTVGTGSMIMVWNIWRGKRKQLIREAHTKMLHGEKVAVAITVAAFDPSGQLLLTGARDGSIKMWNFNTGSCVRNLAIEADCEVSSLTWLPGRILAMGWNRRVAEFLDSSKLTKGKLWELRHMSDILCAAKHLPQCLATGSYTGELILWRLETGQAYRRYNVTTPTDAVKLEYVKRMDSNTGTGRLSASSSFSRNSSISTPRKSISNLTGDSARLSLTISHQRASIQRLSEVSIPPAAPAGTTLAIHAMCFLVTRPMLPDIGTLFASLDSGYVQVYSHHINGGYISTFHGVHTFGDYVITMTTDPENKYLFTGTTEGYIKVWLMENYAVPDEVYICMPALRTTFPFMWKDCFTSRAKRAVSDQPLPLLVNSYRGHTMAVFALEYLSGPKILVSSSADLTVRLWSLGGRYINTLGTYRQWEYIDPAVELRKDFPFRMPPDMKRVASSTTLRVLGGGFPLNQERNKKSLRRKETGPRILTTAVRERSIFGKPLKHPILGHHFKLPSSPTPPPTLPTLDQSMPHIPVYCHLNMHDMEAVIRPGTPPGLLERAHTRDESVAVDVKKAVGFLGNPKKPSPYK